jgi:hypothetical protein
VQQCRPHNPTLANNKIITTQPTHQSSISCACRTKESQPLVDAAACAANAGCCKLPSVLHCFVIIKLYHSPLPPFTTPGIWKCSPGSCPSQGLPDKICSCPESQISKKSAQQLPSLRAQKHQNAGAYVVSIHSGRSKTSNPLNMRTLSIQIACTHAFVLFHATTAPDMCV